MQLSDRLAELRRERGLTLRELRSRIAEVTDNAPSISYSSNWNEDRRPPRSTHCLGLRSPMTSLSKICSRQLTIMTGRLTRNTHPACSRLHENAD